MTTLIMPRPRRDSGMEGAVAKWYASNTAEMMKAYVDLARRIANRLPQGSSVLEVAPGPGYFCIELAKLGSYRITGLDLSHTFVKIASKKAVEAGVMIDFQQGSASALPFNNNSFDFLVCRAAFKNFGQPVPALQEMCRVLKPGATGLLIDLKGNTTPEEINRHVDSMGISLVNRLLTKLAFRGMLLKRAYTKEQFEQMLEQTEFSRVDIEESDIGLEISMTR
jgi:ubiquinone/menaquinone biosynthesis C-methylase UbiE